MKMCVFLVLALIDLYFKSSYIVFFLLAKYYFILLIILCTYRKLQEEEAEHNNLYAFKKCIIKTSKMLLHFRIFDTACDKLS
jgi:hypothetical protein